uniref:sn-1-specific diacylglycerol lipase ABHD11 n=1 Tax=Diabrotica virgifera virgifera TaxID=50390 RepID=A0A6P7G4B1_DIAVI
MSLTRLKNQLSLAFTLHKNTNLKLIRCVSNTGTLQPVDMSYATYESTNSENQSHPFIIIHGLFGSKSNWNSICKYYNQRFNPSRKIIAVDTRNHGDSPHSDQHTYAHLAADIKALYGQLNIKKATIMGHSMGGRASMLFALKYPELVERLIVADISPVTSSPNLDTLPIIFKVVETIKLPSNIPMSQCRTIVDNELAKSIDDKALRAFLLTNLIQKSNGSFGWRINIPSLLTNFHHVTKFPQLNDLQYDGPTLFVAGGKSDYVPYGWRFNTKTLLENFEQMTSFPNIFNVSFEGRTMFLGGGNSDHIQKSDFPKILKLFPNAELKYIEGAGHWLHSEKPAEFLSITLEFLNRRSDIKQLESKTIN